jgi:branched-chain amino acid transport system ATP-binding protein
MLRLEALQASYGQSQVLQGITFEVRAGEVACILGRNGMGKTTTLRAIMGLVRIIGGEISFEGRVISTVQPHLIPRMGISYVPQGRHIFPEFTVRENLYSGVVKGRPDPARLDQIFTLFPRLKERLSQLGASLSGGEQQMLAIGRALLPGPKLLLLDEPTEGLSPLLAQTVRESIRLIKESGMTILLVEQHPREALALADSVSLIEKGTLRLHEQRTEFIKHPEKLNEYLGLAAS